MFVCSAQLQTSGRAELFPLLLSSLELYCTDRKPLISIIVEKGAAGLAVGVGEESSHNTHPRQLQYV